MFTGKKILVCGMAKSGQSAARLLAEMGAYVTVQDMKEEIDWAHEPAGVGLETYLGKNPDDIVGNFDLIVISPGITVYAPFVKKAEELGIPVWGEAELAYRLCLCPMVAITGTNGKTTVTTLVGEILKLHNQGTVVGGNIGIPLTELVTTLTPENIVVAEISSFQLETIVAFKPAISAVLNMTEDHLDRHHTMENYIAMKSRIFENQSPGDICVLNYDNEITREMKPPGKIVYFSAKEQLDEGVYLRDGLIVAKLSADAPEQIITKVSGLKMMAENALAAVALSLCTGASAAKIAAGLQAFRGVPHRMEYVASIDGAEYYNDSKATNTDAAIKAVEALSPPIILIGGGYDKNTDFTPWVESFSGKVSDLIVFGQTSRKIIDTCDVLGFTNYETVNSLQEAVTKAKEKAKPGCKVLFSPACASFDMFKNFEERGDMFKEYVGKGE
ncbi:MAG: UDP-N-acetylmuramoyl-L-alanine--D-glutamate ligase [Firmicutes bacterium]|nr:UDP-N-acetylmuramoyl-L-alanine--D-glutamate ligase [Bacillota bacterium]